MKDLPPLQWLRVFEASARHLSFTRAAEELNITQSAVSQQIKLLENFIGSALFIRRPRALQLTPAGKNYLPDVQRAIELLRASTRSNFLRSEQHRITLRCNWSFASLWLIPRLPDFTRAHPGISLNIVPVMWETDYAASTDSIEIRFASGSGEDQLVVLRDRVTCFPLCSPRLARRIREPADLLRCGRINSLGVTSPWPQLYRRLGISETCARDRAELTSQAYLLALEMARNHLGVMLGVSLITDDLIARGELVRLFDVEQPIDDLYFLKADRARLTHSENLFCDWLLERFE
ncbi:MAG: LysR family transcriptional regulator [Gammaproteobacteria bacterium]|nr:LysR family transcriptional regulator [Gammaproteobacteria bacterium]